MSDENNKQPEKISIICKNFWCKATYFIKEEEMEICDSICPKCKSFDTDLSGGVTSNENKQYDGPRFDGKWHPVSLTSKNWKQ